MKFRFFAFFVLLLFPSYRAQGASKAFDGSLIVDFGDADYSEGGTWQNADNHWEQHGSSGSLSRRSAEANARAQWQTELVPGEYVVDLWNIPFHAQDSKTQIEVTHAEGITKIKRDMRDGFYGWMPLGKFRFNGRGTVKITRGDRTLMVDAARFRLAALVRAPPLLPPYPAPDGALPHIDRPGPTGRLILGGKPYLMLGGELENGSALHPQDIPYMDTLFDTLLAQRINTIEAPIAWRQLEETEGRFDFSVIDALIAKARARNMHLAILWFGTYKNLQSYYSPRWVHTNQKRFPFALNKEGKPQGAVSAFCEEALQLDQRAFKALMNRIKERDAAHQVVLMVQVENEMPSARDYSEAGLKAWQAPVPPELMQSLRANEATLSPWLRDLWKKNGQKGEGTWAQVFGESDGAGKLFGSWFYGRFADAVAKAGKESLNLPMYCNSWRGESPVWHQFMDVFRIAAPNIDFMGPDLYMKTGYNRELELTLRPWNNMVVPENDSRTSASARAWTTYGKYGALYFGSYLGPETEWTQCKSTFEIMENMAPLLLENKATPNMTGFHQEVAIAGDSWDEAFQGGRLHLTATHTLDPSGETNNLTGGETLGCGLVAQSAPGEYVFVGSRLDLEWFAPPGKTLSLQWVEAGRYENGTWKKIGPWRGAPLPQPPPVESKNGRLLVRFPRENATFSQFRCKVEIQ